MAGHHAGLTKERIVDAALLLVDRSGPEGLTMTKLARDLGVTQPAFYSHFGSLQAVQGAVTASANADLAERLRVAVVDQYGNEALIRLAEAYRDYVQQYPNRYVLQMRGIRDPDPEIAAIQIQGSTEAGEIVRAVLRSYGLDEETVVDVHAALRAAIHGFVHLEAQAALGRGTDGDRSFHVFLELLVAGLTVVAAQSTVR
jgi:AcrR family transcriptional regulator